MEILKQILKKKKSPERILSEIKNHPNKDILNLTAVCIAHQIILLSSHKSQLSDILNQFKEYPAKTKTLEMLLCKRRLSVLGNVDQKPRRESDWRYWQCRTDQACIHAFNNLYQLVNGENQKIYFQRFVEQASLAYGYAESARQVRNAQKQIYEFENNSNDINSKAEKIKKFNIFRAHRSHISAKGVAIVEFLRKLREDLL